MRNNNKTILVL